MLQGDHFETVLFNYKRVAKVWLDEDLEFYYKLRPMARTKEVGSTKERYVHLTLVSSRGHLCL